MYCFVSQISKFFIMKSKFSKLLNLKCLWMTYCLIIHCNYVLAFFVEEKLACIIIYVLAVLFYSYLKASCHTRPTIRAQDLTLTFCWTFFFLCALPHPLLIVVAHGLGTGWSCMFHCFICFYPTYEWIKSF